MKKSPKKRILIVDDNTSIHEDFKKILNHDEQESTSLDSLEQQIFGAPQSLKDNSLPMPIYELSFCTQGLEAIDAVNVAAKEGRPLSLIFMDVRMPPGIDGIEATKRIRQSHPDVQVVICSAYSDYTWADMIDELSVTDNLLFLKKPFERIEVLQMALALTTKWQLAKDLKLHIENLEHLVESRTKELEVSRAKGIEASKFAALGEMSAGLCHEINSPLATIMILAEQLKETIGDIDAGISLDDVKQMAGTIHQTGERISKIIKGLRIFSHSEESEPFKNTALGDIIEDTLVFCRSRFKASEVELSVQLDPEHIEINCQPIKISQVLLNLLNNSIDAVEDQNEKWVKVEARSDDQWIELSVTDSGPGIPQEIIEKIMHPFFTTKPVGKGTGLGLSITRGIAEGHGGSFLLDTDSKNTKFVLRLPRSKTTGVAA